MENYITIGKLDIEIKNITKKTGSKGLMSALVANRQLSILKPEEVKKKFEKGAVWLISDPESSKRYFVYLDKSGMSPLSQVHFYDQNGELAFTYPWNGEVNKNGSINYHPFLVENEQLLKSIDVFATPAGKIVVRSTSEIVVSYFLGAYKKEETETSIFECRDGKVKHLFFVDTGRYKKYPNKEIVDDVGFLKDVFETVFKEQDRFLNFTEKDMLVL